MKVVEDMAKRRVNIDIMKWWLQKDGIQPFFVLWQLLFKNGVLERHVFIINCGSTHIWYLYKTILLIYKSNSRWDIVHKSRSCKKLTGKRPLATPKVNIATQRSTFVRWTFILIAIETTTKPISLVPWWTIVSFPP